MCVSCWVKRMKRGSIYGLRDAQLSLILIGLMCFVVLTLAWTKTTFLISIHAPQSHVLHLISEKELGDSYISKGKSSIVTVDQINFSNDDSSVENLESRTEVADENNLEDIEAVSKVSGTDQGKNEFSAETVSSSSGRYDVEASANIIHSQNASAAIVNSGCNLSKGKWILDQNRPLYSGFGCKQWLSSMWACRLTQRKDFEYEKLRWRPKDCEMAEFTGPEFLRRMVNKTLAFVGDSLTRQQFQSMMCMITGGKERPDVLDVGNEYGMITGGPRPDGWAYRFPRTNTTVLYYWSATLCGLIPLDLNNPTTDVAMHLDLPPTFLQNFMHKLDVLVLNTGHHWNRGKLKANRWIMYVNGAPVTDRKLVTMGGAMNYTVYSTISWVNSQLPKYPGLKAFYTTISPRHFFNGEWNTGGTCDNTSPLSRGKEVIQDESSDPLAAGATKGTGVKLLDITALSQLRDEGHISRYSIKATPGVQDCLHWCLPGVPDTWNELLFAQLVSG